MGTYKTSHYHSSYILDTGKIDVARLHIAYLVFVQCFLAVISHYLCTYMATFSGPILNFTGINILANGAGHSKMPFQIHKHEKSRFSEFRHPIALASRRVRNLQKLYFHGRSSATTHVLSAGRNYELNYNDDSRTEPFWLNIIREAIWTTQDLLLFLAEQPSQLKYIEWPSFQSTLKTALLTLVLVAMLIVALSSVDSALSYLLALFLRIKA